VVDEDQVVRAQDIQEEPGQTPAIEISKENASDELFQHLPLDRSVESTFRLLTLLPGPKGSQPRCTLSVNPHGSNGSISMTATLILYDRSGHKLIED
jgi:hypothetical protein